jgi:cytochrome P450
LVGTCLPYLTAGAHPAHESKSILHNPEEYPKPVCFLNERYPTPDGALDPSVRHRRTACFGFGRRICPGRFIADMTLFVTAVILLATVDAVRVKDGARNEIILNPDITPGTVSHARSFPTRTR